MEKLKLLISSIPPATTLRVELPDSISGPEGTFRLNVKFKKAALANPATKEALLNKLAEILALPSVSGIDVTPD